MAARKKTATAEVIPLDPPAPAPAGVRYQSIRLKAQGHKLRFSNTPLKVEASETQTITLVVEPYPHFRVDPGGVEFPMENIASALQIDSGIAQKLSRTGRINERKMRVLKAAEERRKARAAAEVQKVDDEDDEPLAAEVGDE